ncbi:29329_t:CDS:1, partial [Gigaspora margarita]
CLITDFDVASGAFQRCLVDFTCGFRLWILVVDFGCGFQFHFGR